MAFTIGTEFVNIRLSAEEKKEYKKWSRETLTDLGAALEPLVLSNHRMSISHDNSNDTCICSITCRDDESPNSGLCVTSRHREPLEAIMIALFKHTRVLNGQNWKDVARTTDWG